jgi:MFS superfamily sulfate permease-like transporter
LFKTQFRLGLTQLLPFAITIIAVLATDLLKGVIVGIVVGVGFVLFQNSRGAVVTTREPNGEVLVRFRRDGTFLSKPGVLAALAAIPNGASVRIDGTGEYIDHDVKEMIATFLDEAPRREIVAHVQGIDLSMASAGGGH